MVRSCSPGPKPHCLPSMCPQAHFLPSGQAATASASPARRSTGLSAPLLSPLRSHLSVFPSLSLPPPLPPLVNSQAADTPLNAAL